MRAISLVIIGAPFILWSARLTAQETYELSTVVQLEHGIAGGKAELLGPGSDLVGAAAVRPDGRPDAEISFVLLSSGNVIDWVEIRDRESGGRLLATTRPRDRQPPRIGIESLGELLNDPRDGSVEIGLEALLEFTLHVQDGGALGTGPAFVVVGFGSGETAAFPILTAGEEPEDRGGEVVVLTPPGSGIFTSDEGEPAATVEPSGERSGAAAARTDGQVVPTPIRDRTQSTPPNPPMVSRTQPTPPNPPIVARPVGPGPSRADPGPSSAGQGPAAGAVAGTDWNASAAFLRGRNGERFVFRCPAGGAAGRGPWGTDVYADHSSVCTAAVHAGLITLASGGSVTIEIRPGQDWYPAGAGQGGVTSSASGTWPGSFVFVR